MSDPLNEIYQKVILDHSRAPRNFRQLAPPCLVGEGKNPSCGDNFKVYVRLKDQVIDEITFQGSGCAISKAAASVMTEIMQGKDVSEAFKILAAYREMLKTGSLDHLSSELQAFAGLRKFPMRIKCALLPWEGLSVALKGASPRHSPESV